MAYPPEYTDMVRAIINYYDPINSSIWDRVQTGAASTEEILRAYSYIPQVQTVKSASGVTLGYDYAEGLGKMSVAPEIDMSFNSNYTGGSYSSGNAFSANIPQNAARHVDPNTGEIYYTFSSGAKKAGATIATVADKASLAVTGVSLGCKLGAAIDGALYSLDPEWWDTNYPSINPQTWTSLCGENETGKKFFRLLFGINDQTQEMTAYVDERVLAQTYQLLRDKGYWSGGERTAQYDGSTASFPEPSITSVTLAGSSFGRLPPPPNTAYIDATNAQVVEYLNYTNPGLVTVMMFWTADQTPERVRTFYDEHGSPTGQTVYYDFSYGTTYNNTQYKYQILNISRDEYFVGGPIDSAVSSTRLSLQQIATIVIDGSIHSAPTIEGMTPNPDSTQYPPTNITGETLPDVLSQLKQNYPALFDGAITSSVLQDDGTVEDFNYVPVPWPEDATAEDEEVTTGNTSQDNTEIDPETAERLLNKPINADPPDTGSGNSSPIVLPTGGASSLWAVYNPSQSQLNAFGAWLWSSDFVDQLKKLFNDPMQAIIGVHKVFSPVPTGGSQNIKCGYLDSGCPAAVVTSQYTEVDCGTVNCFEYFGNILDYDPNTSISVYLPFIGVVPLKVSEVMRSKISISYGVDVITGACLAKIHIYRDGVGGVLYSYGGSCACHYPISSGSYGGIISGLVSAAVGVAGGVMTGNPVAAIGGLASGLKQAHTTVQHSGGFTGCSGAMGPKKPYLIINRPQARIAENVNLYSGIPSNTTMKIGDCAGYIRVTDVHLVAPSAYNDELLEIEALLKAGVLTN